MQIAILSASTRIERRSHRVALFLEKHLLTHTRHAIDLLDLAEYRFPIFEETMQNLVELPKGLADFAARIRKADAHIFVSPEYNGSYTSALKNAIDCLKEQEFKQKVIGVASVSTGGGGMRGALAMQQLALGIGGFVIPQMLLVPQVHLKFEENGDLLDENFSRNTHHFLQQFLWLAEAVVAKRNHHENEKSE